MQKGFYFDQTRCIGCFTCIVACKDWHDVPAGPASYRRVTTIEKGHYPDVFVAFLTTSCYHCVNPACVDACPAGAITKRAEDGIVVVDREACLGGDACGMCLDACPYKAPQFGAEESPKMQKCTMCTDRWAENKNPICVDACPMRALDAGPLDELKQKYPDAIQECEGFKYSGDVKPAVLFKPKFDKINRPVIRTDVAPMTNVKK